MPQILIDGEFGWFDPGPIDGTDIELIKTIHSPLTPAIEALRLAGLQESWDCPKRGPARRAAASERMRRRWQSDPIPQPLHSDERRQQTSERMKVVWAARRAAKETKQ